MKQNKPFGLATILAFFLAIIDFFIYLTHTIAKFAMRLTRDLRTEITIAAPVKSVWEALVKLEQYNRWNPFIIHGEGEAVEGAVVPIVIQLASQSPQPYLVKILERREYESLRWLGHFKRRYLCDGNHRFLLEPRGGNICHLTHEETFSGLLVPFIWPFLGPKFKESFEALNRSLKQYVEASQADSPRP